MSRSFGTLVRQSRPGQLDDVWVPRIQRVAWACVHGGAVPFLAAHRLEQRILAGRPYRFAWRKRRLLRTVLVVVAVMGSTVHFQRYPDLVLAREAERAAARQQTIRAPGGGPLTDLPRGAVLHGPPVGGSAEDYVADRHLALAALSPGDHLAIVSFTGYLSAVDTIAALPEGLAVLRAQYRVPDINARALETEVVSNDLRTSIDRVVEDERVLLQQEEQSLEELLASGTMGDPAFEADARARVEELRATRNILSATGAIVFAVVVRGSLEDLQALVTANVVRLVDPVPDEADPDTSVYFGLRPEDRERVTFGVTA